MANGADSGAGNTHRNACVAQAPAGTQRTRSASNLEFTPTLSFSQLPPIRWMCPAQVTARAGHKINL